MSNFVVNLGWQDEKVGGGAWQVQLKHVCASHKLESEWHAEPRTTARKLRIAATTSAVCT